MTLLWIVITAVVLNWLDPNKKFGIKLFVYSTVSVVLAGAVYSYTGSAWGIVLFAAAIETMSKIFYPKPSQTAAVALPLGHQSDTHSKTSIG